MKMINRRLFAASRQLRLVSSRPFSQSIRVRRPEPNDRQHTNVDEHRKHQTEKALNQHMTNTQSTLANDMPKVGNDSAPPEFLSSVDPGFKPKDKEAGNTEKMTGGTQESSDLHVGEIEGGKFKIEPLRRTGEDKSTMRARLTYQSRKRGTLESDLLLSTFADTQLEHMSVEQLQQYDLFLDENDWDIYYWATQEPTPTSLETAEGSINASPKKDELPPTSPRPGEWAQTVGTFKPAYRPVPQRWKDSEILAMLRDHVESKKSEGMAFMPRLKTFDH